MANISEWDPFLSYWGSYCKYSTLPGEDQEELAYSEGLLSTLCYETDVGCIPRGIKLDSRGIRPKFGDRENWNKQIEGCYWCVDDGTSWRGICCSKVCLFYLHDWCVERIEYFTKKRFCRLPGCGESINREHLYCDANHKAEFLLAFPQWVDHRSIVKNVISTGPTWYCKTLPIATLDRKAGNPNFSKKSQIQQKTNSPLPRHKPDRKHTSESDPFSMDFPNALLSKMIFKTDIGPIPRQDITEQHLSSPFSSSPNWLREIAGCVRCGNKSITESGDGNFCTFRCYLLFYEWARSLVESLTGARLCRDTGCDKPAGEGFGCCSREHAKALEVKYSQVKYGDFEKLTVLCPYWYKKCDFPNDIAKTKLFAKSSKQIRLPPAPLNISGTAPVNLLSHSLPIPSGVPSRDIYKTDAPMESTEQIQLKAPFKANTNDNFIIEESTTLPEPEISQDVNNSGIIENLFLANTPKPKHEMDTNNPVYSNYNNPFSPSNLGITPAVAKYQLPADYKCPFDIAQTDNIETEYGNESFSNKFARVEFENTNQTNINSPNQSPLIHPLGATTTRISKPFVQSDDVPDLHISGQKTSEKESMDTQASSDNTGTANHAMQVEAPSSKLSETHDPITIPKKGSRSGSKDSYANYQLPADYKSPFEIPQTDNMDTELGITSPQFPSHSTKLTTPIDARATPATAAHSSINTAPSLRLQKSQSLMEPAHSALPDIYPFSLSAQLTGALSRHTDVGAIPRPRAPREPSLPGNWATAIAGCHWCRLSNASFHELTCGRRCWLLFHEWCVRKIESSCGARLCALPGCENSRAGGCACCSLEHIRDLAELRGCAHLGTEDEVELVLGPSWYSDLSAIHFSRTGAFYEFSNYFPSLLLLEGSIWPTVYHYLCARALVGTPYSNHISRMECVKELEMWMKRRTCAKWARADCSGARAGDTRRALLAKFQQNSVLRGLLLRTGRRPLVCRDSSLGDLLVRVRERLETQRFPQTAQPEAHINSVCRSVYNPGIVSNISLTPSRDRVTESLPTLESEKSIQIPKDKCIQPVVATSSDSDSDSDSD